jgi:hypothetical protein
MTDADLRLLLTAAVEAAGMIAIAWVYASDRIPANGSLLRRRTPFAVISELSQERRAGRSTKRER